MRPELVVLRHDVLWQWLRIIGDVVFAAGALLMAYDFLVKLGSLLPGDVREILSGPDTGPKRSKSRREVIDPKVNKAESTRRSVALVDKLSTLAGARTRFQQ